MSRFDVVLADLRAQVDHMRRYKDLPGFPPATVEKWVLWIPEYESAIRVLEGWPKWQKLIEAANRCDQELCYQYLKEIEDGAKANSQLMAIVLDLPALPGKPEGGK